jgi:dolichol-phosphate mannosyltransferase
VRLVICLPTYNERPNLEPMVRALGDVFAQHGLDGRVLVIDDASPDGTGEVADRLAQELSYVDVLHRPLKEGLGPAYLAGFRRALEEGPELVVEMDCDFSHDPGDLPRLVAAADTADVVLGSRYVRGGGVGDWGLLRRVVSRSGCLYARTVLGIRIKDATGGFRVYHRRVLEALPLDRVGSRGYAFQVEMAYRALQSGFSVREVPIVFTDRERGGSKMGPGIAAEAAVRIPALRLAALRRRL